MKKNILIIFLVAMLLSGCFGLGKQQLASINGTVYHHGTVIPVPYAKIKVAGRIYHTDINGQFSARFFTSKDRLQMTIGKAPNYRSQQEILDASSFHVPQVFYLRSTAVDETLVAGRIDYALPELNLEPQSVRFYTHEQNTFSLESSPTELIITPITYTDQIVAEIIFDLGASYCLPYPDQGAFIAGKPDQLSTTDFSNKALEHPLVSQAQLNYPIYPMSLGITPNDNNFDTQWNLQAIYLPQAWSLVKDADHIRVAVLDTGVDVSHPDFTYNAQLAYNATNDNQDVNDPGHNGFSHGSHVSGIIGATTNNQIGIAGITWGVNLIPVRVFNSGNSNDLIIARGIKYAAKTANVEIINLSLGWENAPADPYALKHYRAILEAYDDGKIIVASAGNYNNLVYPAKYDEVIAVGAINAHYQLAHYSPREGVRIFAPGGDRYLGISSTNLSTASEHDNDYIDKAGTSMAAPHVSGVIALILAHNPGIAPHNIEDLLWETGTVFDLNFPNQRLVNAYAAVTNSAIDQVRIVFTALDEPTQQYVIDNVNPDRYFEQRLPAGEYHVTAHIDVDHDDKPSIGDWYEEQLITIPEDQSIFELTLRMPLVE